MSADQHPSNVEVRRWAEAQPWGHKVSGTGGMPSQLIRAWDKAHPDRPYVKSQAHHGTPSGYHTQGCRCDRCTRAAVDYDGDRYHTRAFDEGRESTRTRRNAGESA